MILIGVWSLLVALGVQWASMERLWPLVLMGGGIASLIGGLRAQPREAGSVWFGVSAILSGGLFLYTTIPDPPRWALLGELWPLFVIFAGVGWLAAWIIDRGHTTTLVTGLLAVAIGVAFYLARADVIAWDPWKLLQRWWPLALIVLGVASLVQALARRER
ncbi:MAG: LiaI-LiaF-like domain-containing protein [Anaerolineae bacterium]